MQKKYIVKLTPEERAELADVLQKLKGTSQKVKRAQILLKADLDGPGWIDAKIAEAFDCRVQTVEELRRRLVERGFSEAKLMLMSWTQFATCVDASSPSELIREEEGQRNAIERECAS